MPDAVILSQGNEVTTGQTVDTNSNWLAGRLWDLGWDVRRILCAPDRLEDIVATIEEAAGLGTLVVSTGGLGPTRDDLTAEAAARVLGDELALNEEALAQVVERFTQMGREMKEANRKQAWLPRRSRVLENRWGTAPGFAIEHRGASLFFMPGVPSEMKPMFETHIAPVAIVDRPPTTRVLRTVGLAESHLEHLMREVSCEGLTVGFRTMLPENQVKLRFEADVPERERERVLAQARSLFGKFLFGIDTGDLAEVVGHRLRDRHETVAVAESCTGGGLAGWLSSIPGASAYLLEGAVVYANEAKVRTCAVDPAVLERHGAVSEPVARQLAEGIRNRAGATWGIGITGIAGPDGGTPDKPVGTVHFGVAGPEGTEHSLVRFPGDRARVQRLSAGWALHLLHQRIAS
jgi:nicotinamide-nucleotide amidase